MKDNQPTNAIDRILRTRDVEQRGAPNETFRTFTVNNSKHHWSFSIKHRNGRLDGFMYHNIDNINLIKKSGTDFLSFGHRGTVVTMSGQQLEEVFNALMEYRLMEIFEHDGSKIGKNTAIIKQLSVTTLLQPDKNGVGVQP